METTGIHRKPDSHICTVLEEDEQKPLTCTGKEHFTDIPGTVVSRSELREKDESSPFVKCKGKVKIVHVSRDGRSEFGARSFPRIHSNSQCRPEFVILAIATIFLFLMLTVLCTYLYFSLRQQEATERTISKSTTEKFDNNSQPPTTFSETKNFTAIPPVTTFQRDITLGNETKAGDPDGIKPEKEILHLTTDEPDSSIHSQTTLSPKSNISVIEMVTRFQEETSLGREATAEASVRTKTEAKVLNSATVKPDHNVHTEATLSTSSDIIDTSPMATKLHADTSYVIESTVGDFLGNRTSSSSNNLFTKATISMNTDQYLEQSTDSLKHQITSQSYHFTPERDGRTQTPIQMEMTTTSYIESTNLPTENITTTSTHDSIVSSSSYPSEHVPYSNTTYSQSTKGNERWQTSQTDTRKGTNAPKELSIALTKSTTDIEKTSQGMPIFFMTGPFTFKEAKAACYRNGATLALKEDLQEGWNLGYNRCTFGWLRDMHVAMVMQREHKSMDCDKGKVGVRYKAAKEPLDKYSGAYCVKETDDFDINHLKISSNGNNTVNWWVTLDPSDAYNLRHALTRVKSKNNRTYPLMQSLKSIYTCCNAFNMSATDEAHPKTFIATKQSSSYLREVVSFYRREMAPARIFTHVSARYNGMIKYGSATTNRSDTIKALVALAKNVGLDGLIFDYEPRKNYTREHAEIYRIFLDELTDAMNANNMSLGTVISSWGILQYYDIYARSKVEVMRSMASTYYGHDIEKNKERVLDMLGDIKAKRLEIGLGLMHSETILKNPRRDYRWKEEELRNFLTWTSQQGIRRLHVYPGHWRAHRAAEPFFLQALADIYG